MGTSVSRWDGRDGVNDTGCLLLFTFHYLHLVFLPGTFEVFSTFYDCIPPFGTVKSEGLPVAGVNVTFIHVCFEDIFEALSLSTLCPLAMWLTVRRTLVWVGGSWVGGSRAYR